MRLFQTFDNIIDDLREKSLLLKKSRETVSLKNKEYQQKLQEYETLKEYFTKSATGRSIVDSIEDKFKSYNSSFLDLLKREEKLQNKLQKSIDSIYRKNPDIVKLQEYKNIIPENKFTELLVTLTKSHKQGLISKDRVLDLKKYKRVDLEKGSVYVKDDRTHYSDCIVINELNEVLLLKRNKLDSFEAAKYCLPGGHVDDGEDFQYAALRELVEETGIKSETAVPSGEYTDNKIVIHYFTVKVEKDKCNVFLDEREHQQYEWVPMSDIHNYPLIKNLDKNFEDVILIPTWVINHDLAPNFYIWNNSGSFLSKPEIKQVYLANKLYKSYKDGLIDYEHYKNHIKHNDIDVQMFSIYNLSQKPLYGLKLINSIEKSEKIEGGLADGKSIEEIATHHSTPVEQISKQLEMGIKVEMEHTNDKEKAEEIAKDHLWEIPDYYTRLDKMESEADEIEKAKRAEIGEIREWSGRKMQKTAQGWVPVKKEGKEAKGEGESESIKKPEKQKEYSEKELQEIARKTSEQDLKTAATGGDEKLRIAAKRELVRREEEETPKKGADISNDKQRQLDIILSSNSMKDDIHTGIRSINDIKTAEEVFSGDEFSGAPDFTKKDAERALKSGKIKIYSSYPIKNGVFVSPSQMEAKNYAGGGKVYSKEIGLNEVAWVDSIEGQVALLESKQETTIEDGKENSITDKIKGIENKIKELRSADIDYSDIDALDKNTKRVNELIEERKKLKEQEANENKKEFKDLMKGYKSFNNIEESRLFYGENAKEISDYLNQNPKEQKSLGFYLDEGFRTIRQGLSSDKKEKDLLEHSKHISNLINNNKIKENLVLNRRVDSKGVEFFSQLNKNDIYSDKSFSSCSLNELEHFGDYNITILAKKGKSVANANNFSEREFLIDKGSSFKVLDKNDKGIIVELL